MSTEKKNWMLYAAFLGTTIFVFVLGLFAASIMERRVEAMIAYKPIKPMRDFEPRNHVWGANFPREFTSYLQTAQVSFKSKYNSSDAVDMLKEDPYLVVLWAGYAFSKDYNQPRGHYYAVTDLRNTLRTAAPKGPEDGPMPGTCWSCKSPDVPRMMNQEGIQSFYKGKWAGKGHEVVNPVGCADCHDPKTMDLQITRPALKEAFERMGKDINKATHQEKRSLVCAQCHVEYYFKGKEFYLTFPWDKGMSVEDMEKYYDEISFTDWTHAVSKAPMLKAQHPEYETFQFGIHAQRGVACADCHMPYVTEGGIKYTDHHVQSPLNNINRSCQVCHRESEEELKKNVYDRQDRVYELRMKAEKSLAHAHIEAKEAWDKGATKEEMASPLKLIRHAQWRWDYAVASHGASFHAPLETSRILGTSIEKSGQARLELSRILAQKGITQEVAMPDISTKEKAQKYIGLDMETLKKEKKVFLETVVPQWDAKAAERQKSWD
ncbi:MAG: ammonia-forming cytochrome c nitrite reductase [Candidatus Brocadiae bacterium]|nr:ammonia-forming cytochrome c nitrite reductase [Candidatus Brocadiia bacterium]